jgi:hypothetical protein
VVDLPGLPEAGDVSDWLRNGGTKDELVRLVEATPAWTPDAVQQPKLRFDIGRPEIIVNNRPLDSVTEEALDALQRRNDPPTLFVRSGRICRIRLDERGRPLIENVGEHELRCAMAQAAHFFRITDRGCHVHVSPPKDVVHNLAALGDWEFPPLEAIVETPVIRSDGTVLERRGYDRSTRLYLAPTQGFKMPRIPDSPDRLDVAAARDTLLEVIEDFPFVDDASQANALALMLTLIMRPAIPGRVPAAIVDSPRMGTGKGLLTEAICLLGTGREAAMVPAPLKEEEWRKVITSLLSEGSTFIAFDEVAQTLSSRSLSAVLTAPVWQDRILGVNQTVTIPPRATCVLIGNNISLGRDLPRRCYWIRMNPKTSQPWLGRRFRHDDLLAWVMENRGELIAALLTLVRAYFAAKCPKPKTPRLGKFEAWSHLVGGVLEYAGVDGFLGNLQDLYEQLDESTGQWERFLRGLHTLHGGGTWTVARIVEDLHRESLQELDGNSLRDWLPDELVDAHSGPLDKKAEASFRRRLGKALAAHKDTPYGDEGIHLERVGDDKHRGVAAWRVCRSAGLAGLDDSLRV